MVSPLNIARLSKSRSSSPPWEESQISPLIIPSSLFLHLLTASSSFLHFMLRAALHSVRALPRTWCNGTGRVCAGKIADGNWVRVTDEQSLVGKSQTAFPPVAPQPLAWPPRTSAILFSFILWLLPLWETCCALTNQWPATEDRCWVSLSIWF